MSNQASRGKRRGTPSVWGWRVGAAKVVLVVSGGISLLLALGLVIAGGLASGIERASPDEHGFLTLRSAGLRPVARKRYTSRRRGWRPVDDTSASRSETRSVTPVSRSIPPGYCPFPFSPLWSPVISFTLRERSATICWVPPNAGSESIAMQDPTWIRPSITGKSSGRPSATRLWPHWATRADFRNRRGH